MKVELTGNHSECLVIEAAISLRNDKVSEYISSYSSSVFCNTQTLTTLDRSECPVEVYGAQYLSEALGTNTVRF